MNDRIRLANDQPASHCARTSFKRNGKKIAHSFLMEFTTALVNGEARSVVYVLIFAAFVKVLRNMKSQELKNLAGRK